MRSEDHHFQTRFERLEDRPQGARVRHASPEVIETFIMYKQAAMDAARDAGRLLPGESSEYKNPSLTPGYQWTKQGIYHGAKERMGEQYKKRRAKR